LKGIFFHKIMDRETLSRQHNDLNTADNMGLIKSFSTSTNLYNVLVEI
jgi:hypothetical protein